MIRLLYFSQATHVISEKQIVDILHSSRKNNAILDITGVLIHGGGLFMQVLEGREQAVIRLYAKMLDDRRHENCRIIYISPASERIFQGWSMGSIDCDPLEFQDVAALQANRLESVHAKEFKKIMREFCKKLNVAKAMRNAVFAEIT